MVLIEPGTRPSPMHRRRTRSLLFGVNEDTGTHVVIVARSDVRRVKRKATSQIQDRIPERVGWNLRRRPFGGLALLVSQTDQILVCLIRDFEHQRMARIWAFEECKTPAAGDRRRGGFSELQDRSPSQIDGSCRTKGL